MCVWGLYGYVSIAQAGCKLLLVQASSQVSDEGRSAGHRAQDLIHGRARIDGDAVSMTDAAHPKLQGLVEEGKSGPRRVCVMKLALVPQAASSSQQDIGSLSISHAQ